MEISIRYPKRVYPKQTFNINTKNGKIRGFQPAKITTQADNLMAITTLEVEKESCNWDSSKFTENTYIEATIILVLPIPKSINKKKLPMYQDRIIRPTKRPDIDNISKAVLDCHNGMLFPDDSMITKLTLEKQYGEEEETLIHYKAFNLLE